MMPKYLKYPATAWGMAVKAKLVERCMTQTELADHVGTTYWKISRLVRGIYKEEELEARISEFLQLEKAS